MPTRSEMREIEASNRFYTENGAYYMTGVILHNSAQDVPMTSVITFILSGTRLVTVRYADPRAFPLYVARAAKGDAACATGAGVMIGLIEMLIEREADLIERDPGRGRAHGACRVRPEGRWRRPHATAASTCS